MLLHDLLMLLHNAAQICDFKGTQAHCEFTIIFNDLHVSVLLWLQEKPMHLNTHCLWYLGLSGCAEMGGGSSTFTISSLSSLLLPSNTSILSLIEPHVSYRNPLPSWLMGPLSATEGDRPASLPGQKQEGESRRGHDVLSLWQLEEDRKLW
jgi:hypothetical protein